MLVESVLVKAVLVEPVRVESALVEAVLVEPLRVEPVLVEAVLVQSVLVEAVLVQALPECRSQPYNERSCSELLGRARESGLSLQTISVVSGCISRTLRGIICGESVCVWSHNNANRAL